MSDLISRQDALKPFCVASDGTRIPEVDCDNFPVEFSVKFIKKHLLSLPSADRPTVDKEYLINLIQGAVYDGEACEKLIDLVDRPTGEVNAVEIYEKAVNDLDHNRITLGEFNKRIEPLKHLFYGRPTGEWVFDDDEGEYVCSECKRLADIDTTTGEWVLSMYCGDCGAYMKGESK